MGINKVQYGNTTLIDLTSDTVTADKLMQGYTAHDRTGALITGTATGGGSGGNVWQDAQGYVHLDDEGTTPITVEPLPVTQNGTYTAPTGKAYSPVTVNVSGGGGGNTGLVYESGTFTPSQDTTSPIILFSDTHTIRPLFAMIADSETTDMGSSSIMYWLIVDFTQMNANVYADATNKMYQRITMGNRTATSVANASSSITDLSKLDDYISSTEIVIFPISSNRTFRAGRTYKWIAVWAPTT